MIASSAATLIRSACMGLGCIALLAFPPRSLRAQDEFGQYRPPPQFTERTSQSTYVTMRDGVRIAVRIDRPARGGAAVEQPLPVIGQFTLTIEDGKGTADPPPDAGLQSMPALTRWGYVVVEVARRGNGQSFGSRRGYNDRTESDDAYEITEWLARQSWSDGQVGIYGCSNTGDAAMHAMEARPPHLRAVFAGCFSWSKYDAMRRGGIFAQWGTGPQRTLEEDVAITPVQGDSDKVLLRQAALEHQLSTNLYELWKSLPYRDSWSPLVASRFWVEGSAGSFADQLRQQSVPLYILGGWHDELRDQGLIALLNLPNSRIVLGPWKHCMNDGFPLLQEIHRFFDTYLRRAPTHLQEEPRIHYFTMAGESGGQWRTATAWPVPATQPLRLYFQAKATLSHETPTRWAIRRDFRVSAHVSCPAGGGGGPYMQPCHVPGEGVSFTTAPLRKPLEVTGNPVTHIRIAADRPDANLFAYLEDVSADGSAYVVTEGRLKASLRATAEAPFQVPGTPWHRSFQQDARPLQAGQSVDMDFDLLPTSYEFAATHRLQLTITAVDYRERDPDPSLRGEQVTVVSDQTDPSFIVLPTKEAH